MANLDYLTTFMPYAWHEGKENVARDIVEGSHAEMKVAAWINGISDETNYLFNNILIPSKESISNDTEMDLLWLGPFGIVVVEVKGYKGLVEVHSGHEWIGSYNQGRSWSIKNPVNQCMRQCKELRSLLKARGLKVPVQGLVVMPKLARVINKDTPRLPVLRALSELKVYRSEVLTDNIVKNERLKDVIAVLKSLSRL